MRQRSGMSPEGCLGTAKPGRGPIGHFGPPDDAGAGNDAPASRVTRHCSVITENEVAIARVALPAPGLASTVGRAKVRLAQPGVVLRGRPTPPGPGERRRKRKAEPHTKRGVGQPPVMVTGWPKDRVRQQPRRASRGPRHERRRKRAAESDGERRTLTSNSRETEPPDARVFSNVS